LQTPEMAGHYEARSTFQAIATIVREERVAGLYRGIASPLVCPNYARIDFELIFGFPLQLTVALMNGLVFASYKFLLKLQLGDSDSVASLTQIALAGAGSGIVSSCVFLCFQIQAPLE
jgi:solute carrier family 25 carnitine/acylcarnitine transporter 20/29